MERPSASARAATPLLALLLAACGGGEELPEGEERTAAVVEARAQGLAHLQQDRLGQAEAEFRRLAELAPEDEAGPASLALVALRRGDGREAERRARQALERAPRSARAHLILAKALELQGGGEDARRARRRALELDPGNLRALWTLAGGSSERGEPAADAARRSELLARIVDRAPSSLPARMELAEARLAAGEAGAAAAHLEEVRALVPDFPAGAAAAFDQALARARADDVGGAREPAARFHDLLRTTPAYQAGLQELRGPEGEATGFPVLSFSHEISLEVPEEGAVLEALRFADATEFAGLDAVGGPGGGGGASEDGPTGAGAAPVAALGDVDGDRDQDLYLWNPGAGGAGDTRLLRNDLGRFVDMTPEAVREVGAVRAAAFADYDADGLPDLYLVREGPNRLFHSLGDGGLRDVSRDAGVADPGAGRAALFADLDHDGDLDLLLANEDGNRLYRNDGDGGFTDVPGAMGLDDGQGGVGDAEFADFDDDGDLDLVAARGAGGLELFANLRQDRFVPVADSAGLGGAPAAEAVAAGDYDNDGHPDLVVAGPGAPPALYRNLGDGRFRRDREPERTLPALGPSGAHATLLDFDNDGHLDLALAGVAGGRGAALLRNDGTGAFEDFSRLLPAELPRGRRVAVLDYNEDGDQDLLLGHAGGLRLLRNDGGNVNHHVQLRLVARGPGSGKVNRFGVGSKVEVRAGDLYQTRTVRGPVTHFGLGRRLKADVVRIVWTNGVPQYLYFPGTDQELLEAQELKGSCAFVYAWDGKGYEFVTDAMWRSALGMPVGIMGGPAAGHGAGDGATPQGSAAGPTGVYPGATGGVPGGRVAAREEAIPEGAGPGAPRRPSVARRAAAASGRSYAPPAASREYLRIPGHRLRPLEGRYRLQLTEELWEVAYVDEVKLLAVDHPDSVELFVDEKFVPPAPPRLRLYSVRERLLPASATDGEGNDLLPALRARDARYVSDLRAGPHQGIVEPHALELELPPEAAAHADRGAGRGGDLFLFLQGWVFPTDASINVAVSQSDSVEVRPPRLEVPDGRGGWRTAVPDVGFPAGKDKTVVVELGGVVNPRDPRVRIRTNMQVYWDHAFFAAGVVAGPAVAGDAEEAARRLEPSGTADAGPDVRKAVRADAGLRVRLLRPAAADLHYRGFSREYRRGGRHGPHWFDYGDVSTESPWLPIQGSYTRYGDVLPLLGAPDDMYVVMAPGDEMTVEFDAASPPDPGPGRTRTFLLYTDGWIKDADLNTATGSSVEPLPFHAQSRYPHGPGEAYPRDSAHRAYLERYQTREVRGTTLRLAPGGAKSGTPPR